MDYSISQVLSVIVAFGVILLIKAYSMYKSYKNNMKYY